MMGLYIIQTMEILKVINLRDEIIEKERVSQTKIVCDTFSFSFKENMKRVWLLIKNNEPKVYKKDYILWFH